MYSYHSERDVGDENTGLDEIIKRIYTILEGDVIESNGYKKISLEGVVKWKPKRRKKI